MKDNPGVNFAGWMIGVMIVIGVVVPAALTLLCCFGGALAGVLDAGSQAAR